jgi:hypothetical protein
MTIAITRHPTNELAERGWRTEEIVQPVSEALEEDRI